MPSLADSLELVLPALDPALADAAAVRRLRSVALVMPPIHRAGFECRLENDQAQVDLQQGICFQNGEPAGLAAFVASATVSPKSAPRGVWGRIGRLCETWHADESTLSKGLAELWLEVDVPVSGGRNGNRLSDLVPSVFVKLRPATGSAADSTRLAREVVSLLADPGEAVPLHAAVTRCAEACPSGAWISHLGLMLGRESAGCRIHLSGLRLEDLAGFLERVAWPGDATEIRHLARKLFEFVDSITLCLDVAERVGPQLGLECFFVPRLAREPRLGPLLAHLVATGLCSAVKRDALLRWPGHLSPPEAVGSWPDSLIARALIEPAQRFGVLDRRWSHLKLTCVSGCPPRAKAYFGFEPAWLATAEDEKQNDRRAHSRPPVPFTQAGLAHAIQAATSFLLRSRNQGGMWSDFFARVRSTDPLGSIVHRSDEWVSAYVGWSLASGPGESGGTVPRAVWELLCERRGPEDGWGYNAQCPQDADGTAWALRLAQALRIGETERVCNARRLLLRQMSADGGISGYAPGMFRPEGLPDGWSSAHASITAAAAVLSLGPGPVDYLLRHQRDDGSWTDYWWDDEEVTTARAVEALLGDDREESRRAARRAVTWAAGRIGATGAVRSTKHEGDSTFATALCLEILVRGHDCEPESPSLRRATGWLLGQQNENGSFPASAWMRAPPAEAKSSREAPGLTRSFLDDNAVYTTATALIALNSVYALGSDLGKGE